MAKKQRTIYLEDDIYDKISAIYKMKNFSTISELVDTAIQEWLAREAGQEASVFMSKQLVSLIENTLHLSEQRINRMLFKLAVSDAELKHVLATEYSIDERYLEKIHERSEREIRLTNGMLNLNQVIDGQNGVDEL